MEPMSHKGLSVSVSSRHSLVICFCSTPTTALDNTTTSLPALHICQQFLDRRISLLAPASSGFDTVCIYRDKEVGNRRLSTMSDWPVGSEYIGLHASCLDTLQP